MVFLIRIFKNKLVVVKMRGFKVGYLPGTSGIGRLSIARKRKNSSEIKSISEKDNMTLTISSTKNAYVTTGGNKKIPCLKVWFTAIMMQKNIFKANPLPLKVVRSKTNNTRTMAGKI
jgi:hypothetical protein